MRLKAFTVVEFLVLIAIVLLVAAIVAPNLELQRQRTLLSRGRAELRTAATALEAYAADYSGAYPYDGYYVAGPPTGYNYWYLPYTLSTPVAYLLSNRIIDPYRAAAVSPIAQFTDIRYTCIDSTWGPSFWSLSGRTSNSVYYPETLKEYGKYRLTSVGPDGTYGPYGWNGVSNYISLSMQIPYDSTNGLVSSGDIMRTQKSEIGYLNMAP